MIDLNKDGVLSADDLQIYHERAIQYGNMNEQQTERSARRNAELIAAWFGPDDKHITLEQFLYGGAMSIASTCTGMRYTRGGVEGGLVPRPKRT